jgi:hypothetical protein
LDISRRLPSRQQLTPVFSVIVLVFYSWTMMWFFWLLTPWRNFLRTGEILVILAYSLTTNLIESIVALGLPITLGVLLPRKWFLDHFVARGAALASAGGAALIVVAFQFTDRRQWPDFLRSGWKPALLLVAVAVLVYLAGRIPVLGRAVEGLAERATILLYFWVPLSVLAIVVVAVRLLS